MVKKLIALALALTGLIGCLSGCGKNKEPSPEKMEGGSKNNTSSVGSYVQEEIPIPVDGYPQDMVMLSDGRLWAAITNEGTATLLTSNPERTDWEKKESLPEEMLNVGKLWTMAISEWGELFAVTYTGDGENEAYQFRVWYQDSTGAVKELELHGSDIDFSKETMLFEAEFIDQGRVLATLEYPGLWEIDLKTGEISENKDDKNVIIRHIQKAGDTVYLTGYDAVTMYQNGEIREPMDAAEQQISAEQKANEGNSNSKLTFWVSPDNYLFFTTRDGLFSSVPGGSITEQLISGDRSAFGDPSFYAVSMVGASDKSFYVLGRSDSAKLYHYVYDPETVTPTSGGSTTSCELNIYMLHGEKGSTAQEDIQKVVNQYQIANPTVTVNLEIGIDGENGVTEADAVRTLNTKILAGEGPDLIYLDGLDMDTFMDKGILADLSQVLSQSGPMVDAVTHCYETNGKIYAVPTAFAIPAIYGPEKVISQIHDLDSLLEVAEARDSSLYDSTFGSMFAELMGDKFYDSCSAAWFHDDGTLDTEKLEQYYDAMAKIFALDADYREQYADALEKIAAEGGFEPLPGHFTGFLGGMDAMRKQYLSYGSISGMDDWSYILAGDQNFEGNEVLPLNLQASGVFIPKRILGVMSGSPNQQEAENFISFVLGNQAQAGSGFLGFPVNRAVLDQQIAEDKVSNASFGDDDISADALWPDSTRRQMLNDWIDALTTPASTNWIIRDMILEQLEPCCNGEITPEEAAKAAVKSLNLYLSE